MMKQVTLFKKLGAILSELTEQYEFLSQNPEKLNELELELFHANANFLTDHVQIIKKLNSSHETLALPAASEVSQEVLLIAEEEIEIKEEPEAIEAILDEEPVQEEQPLVVMPNAEIEETFEEVEPIVAKEELFKLDMAPSSFEFILNDHDDTDKFDFEEEKGVGEMFDRPLSEEEQKILEQKQKVKEKIAAPPVDLEEDELGPEPFLVSNVEPEVKIMEEDLALVEAKEPIVPEINKPVEDPNYKPTLNDILAGKNTPLLSTNQSSNSSPAIKDLKQAISLNDKLLYIKDLFNGYNLAYAEAIDLANKLPNFEAADNFFQSNYAGKNNWADKQGTVDKFYRLLNQRFKTPNP